jgi:hypothetical protein
VVDIYNRLGIKQQTEEKIEAFYVKALSALNELILDNHRKQVLSAFAMEMRQRKK